MGDAYLLEQYRANGHSRWLEVLFKRYMHLVYGVCMKYLKNQEAAADATQMLFEKLLADLKTYEIENFEHWLYRVTRNHCLMILRKEKSQPNKAPEYALEILTDQEEDRLEKEAWEEQLQRLENQLEQLKPDQRTCLKLFYLQKNSYQEIVEKTGYNLKEIKSHIQNGKRNLRNALQS